MTKFLIFSSTKSLTKSSDIFKSKRMFLAKTSFNFPIIAIKPYSMTDLPFFSQAIFIYGM